MENEEFDGYEIYRDYDKSRRKYAIKQMFKKANIAADLKDDFNFILCCFYLLKTLICLSLNRRGHKGFGIMVICYDEYSCIDSLSWEYVSVGEGVFKNWKVDIGTDGT